MHVASLNVVVCRAHILRGMSQSTSSARYDSWLGEETSTRIPIYLDGRAHRGTIIGWFRNSQHRRWQVTQYFISLCFSSLDNLHETNFTVVYTLVAVRNAMTAVAICTVFRCCVTCMLIVARFGLLYYILHVLSLSFLRKGCTNRSLGRYNSFTGRWCACLVAIFQGRHLSPGVSIHARFKIHFMSFSCQK